jgi:hypothetical protein
LPDEQQREDSRTLVKMMQELSDEKPKMWGPSMVGFGDYHYVYASGREGDIFRTGFAPRKGNLVIYCGLGRPGLEPVLKKLGKYKASKGCLYIQKLADIDMAVLRKLIASGLVDLTLPREQPKAKSAKKASNTSRKR